MNILRKIWITAAVLFMAACSDSDPVEQIAPPEPPGPEPPEPITEKYEIGDHYKEGNVEGIVYKVDESGEHGMIVSLDEAELIWSTEMEDLSWKFGNFSFSDGRANVECIKTIENWQKKYPAVKWCDAKNVLSLTAWYLPALHEMRDVFIAFNGGAAEKGDEEKIAAEIDPKEAQARFNKCLTDAGGMPLSIDDYWTSTQFGIQDAYTWSFLYGDYSPYDTYKGNIHKVRAVRKF